MGRARGVLAVVVVLSGLRTVGAEPCPPRVLLAGDGDAVVRVRDELRRLGVAIGEPAPGCRAVRAQVELDREGGIAVAIVDGSRRSEGRAVSDAMVAAAWIDSWLRDDVDGLGPAPMPRQPRVAAAAPSGGGSAGEPRDGVAATTPSRSVFDRFALGGGYESVWTSDGASAIGAGARACVRVGPTCLGLAGHYAREDDRTIKQTAMRRRDAALLAVASVPIAVGRMSVSPELGAGFGRRFTERLESCKKPAPNPSCDPTDPGCAVPPPPECGESPATKVYVGDGLSAATYTPRFEAALRVALPVFDHVWVEGLASVTFAPFGHSAEFSATSSSKPPIAASELALPGEPDRAIQLGVALRVGSP
jgi:hypothetical protein